MLSFALGSLKIEKSEDKEDIFTEKQNKGSGIFGFIKNREISVLKELEKYGSNVDKETLKILSDVLDKNNFNVRMLVATDYWFRGNNRPKVFTPEMFSESNIYFLEIKSIIKEDKKNWEFETLATIITYAKYLRDHVYTESGEIGEVFLREEDYNDELNFDVYENEDEYD